MKNNTNITISDGNVFIDLRLDYAFKITFGKPGNEDLLLKLVRAILPQLNITSVTLANQEEVGPRPNTRKAVLDVHCTTAFGEDIIIEMQCAEQFDFGERLIFYSAFAIQNGVMKGKRGPGTYKFPELYAIGITDFVMEIARDDMILYGIRDIGSMKEIPQEYIDAGLEKMFEICRFAKLSKEMQEAYLQEFMKKLDRESQLFTAERRGRKAGIAEGRVEGRAETARDTAKKLRDLGVDPSLISQATGLTVADIQQL